MAKKTDKPDWPNAYAAWQGKQGPLDGAALLKLRMACGPATSEAAAIAQEVVPATVRWLKNAYPLADYPPVHIAKVLANCLVRYGKAAHRRHGELTDWAVSWAEFLAAQSDIPMGEKPPAVWSVFNDLGVQRYNRSLDASQRVDGRQVRRMAHGTAAAMRAAMEGHDEKWQRLVAQWETSRQVISRTLLSCPGLSPEAAVVLESHLVCPAYLVADTDAINALDSGALPAPKVQAAQALLVELERDPYTARRFYDAVQLKGAIL